MFFQLGKLDVFAGLEGDRLLQFLPLRGGGAFHFDEGNPGGVGPGAALAREVAGKLFRADGERAQGGGAVERAGVAFGDVGGGVYEIGRGCAGQLEPDEHVALAQMLQLRGAILADHDVEHLVGDGENGIELVGFEEDGADVDRDDDVGAHGLHGLDREVAGEAAVDQGLAADPVGRKGAGHGHAGAHGLGEAAASDDDFLAGLDIGGDGAEGDGQPVEIVDPAHGEGEFAQVNEQLPARDEAFG